MHTWVLESCSRPWMNPLASLVSQGTAGGSEGSSKQRGLLLRQAVGVIHALGRTAAPHAFHEGNFLPPPLFQHLHATEQPAQGSSRSFAQQLGIYSAARYLHSICTAAHSPLMPANLVQREASSPGFPFQYSAIASCGERA